MQEITVGMIVYCLLCVVVLIGLTLYQEIKHNRAMEEPDEKNGQALCEIKVARTSSATRIRRLFGAHRAG